MEQQNATELFLILKALSFAADKHKNQRRKNIKATPYINHPIDVAQTLCGSGGVSDITVLCAAVLHDTLEDTETTPEELKELFGEKVLSIVSEVTDDKKLPKKERKDLQISHAPNLSREAKLVKLADKICNLRDILFDPPAAWTKSRKREYIAWAVRVVNGLRGVNTPLEKIFDSLIEKPV